MSFSASRDGTAHLGIKARTFYNNPNEPILDFQGHIGLRISPNCTSTRCTIATDQRSPHDYDKLTEQKLVAETRRKAIDIVRVAWTTLDEFPGRGAEGVIHHPDGLDYGYYRQRIPIPDDIPWRRCRFSPETAEEYRQWREITGYGPVEIDFVCSSLESAAGNIHCGIGPEGVMTEFLDEGPFVLEVSEGKFPIVRFAGDEIQQPLGRRL